MKTRIVTSIDGERVTLYQPETEEDVRKLREMAEKGDLDDRESFGDDPDAWDVG